MRVTVTHNQPKQEVKKRIDGALDDIITGMPGGFVQIFDEQKKWTGDQLDFAFNARAGFMNVPVKGFVLVEDRQVTIDVDLPAFISQFLPESQMKTGIESRVKGLLT